MSEIDFRIAERVDWAAKTPPIDWPECFGPDRARLMILRKEEFGIARSFHAGPRWPYCAAALAGFSIWLGLFPLTILHLVNPLVACGSATLITIASFVIGHEAMHGNLGGKRDKSFDFNGLVGWISLVPAVIPFTVARITHAAHHGHCNDPLRDPDFCDNASSGGKALIKTWYNRQPGVPGVNFHYKRVLNDIATPEAATALRHGIVFQLTYLATLFTLAWTGHALTAAMVWWLPRQLALSYIRLMFSWAPHHPRTLGAGRYANTRVFHSHLGHLLSMGMQYHLIHHLYPNMLIHQNKPAFDAMRHILVERGVDCSALPLRR